MMMRGFALALLTSSLLAGCATPETRLRNGLMGAGLSRDTSACMADRMIDKLSLTQLKRLSDLSKISETRLATMRVGAFWRQIRALRDPEILAITTRAGLSCAISE
ncbi:MAG: hypothetical protein RIR59_1428 [Pseudomonadota bacterium]